MVKPWLAIIGVGEDGPAGLTTASRDALTRADIIFGARRHLDLLGVQGREWPLPFSTAPLLAHRGQNVVALASGDQAEMDGGSVACEGEVPLLACVAAPSANRPHASAVRPGQATKQFPGCMLDAASWMVHA